MVPQDALAPDNDKRVELVYRGSFAPFHLGHMAVVDAGKKEQAEDPVLPHEIGDQALQASYESLSCGHRVAALGFAAAQILRTKHGWGTVHGPVAATLMIVVRLGWAVEPHGDLIDHHGMRHTPRRDGCKRTVDAVRSAHDCWSEQLPRFNGELLRESCAEVRALIRRYKQPLGQFAIAALLAASN
eukprot:2145489-Amphidinium_carterae.1